MSLTCRVKLVFEGDGGFFMFTLFLVCRLFVQNVWGPAETQTYITSTKKTTRVSTDHYITPSLHHSITPSLHHSITTDTPTDSHKASFTVRTHLKIKLWTDSYSTWSSVFPAIEQCFRSIIKNKQFNVNNVNMHRSSPSAGDHVSSEVWAVGFTLSHSHCWLDCLSAKWTHSYITWSPQWRSQAQCFINHSESERWRHSHTCASVQLFGRWVQTKQNTFISGLEPNTEV